MAVYGFTAVATANLAVFDHPSRRLAARDIVLQAMQGRGNAPLCIGLSHGLCVRINATMHKVLQLPVGNAKVANG